MTQSNAALEKAGYDEGAEVTLEEALELAKGHHFEGNYLLAERTYRDILRAAPDHFPTIHFLGVLLYQTTVFDEALIYLQKSVEAEPGDKNCWNNLGATYTELKNFEKAIECYRKSLDIDPDFVDALNNMALTLWHSKEWNEAYDVIMKSIKLDPENMDARISQGIILSSQGKHQEAVDIWKKLSEEFSGVERIWINWGNTLREMGRLAESEAKCRKAIELNSKHPEAQNNLANVLRDRGKPEEALEHYKKATDLRPDYFDAHTNAAIALCDQGRYEEASISARYAVAFKRDNTRANSTLSLALRNLGDFTGARAASIRAIKSSPDEAEPYLDLSEVNLMSDFLYEAEAALQEALKREPDSARAYKKLSEIKDKMGDLNGAIEAIDKAIELASDMPIMWLKKGQVLMMMNRPEETFECYDKAIELAPHWHMPYQVKAEGLVTVNENEQAKVLAEKAMKLNSGVPGPVATMISIEKVKSEDDENLKKLLKMLETEMKWGLGGACVLHYALADAYEQIKLYDKAFEHLKKANDYKRQTIPFNPERNSALFGFFKERYTPAFIKSMEGKGYESETPIFIVGMPRSGTTLTEQIISSHPEVYGAGELQDVATAREELGGLTTENCRALGELYVKLAKERDKSGKAKMITDKMPGNYSNLGLIACMLPNAKIIHTRRNPVDTCLSCYKQNFSNGQYWSYNLEELAEEYNRYLDLMNHWRKVLPGRFLEIDYEETVGNFEEQARKLIDFCGLEWDDACLEPHKQKRAVLTASKAQVTKPIYKSSVEKWKRYEEHLQPLVQNIHFDQVGKD